MFNLLPQEERLAIGREYRLRLIAASLLFLVSLCTVASVALIPSLFLSYQNEQAVLKSHKALKEEIDLTAQNNFSNILKLTGEKVAALKVKTPTLYSYELIGDIISKKTAGVRIVGVDIRRKKDGSRDIAIIGISKDRETLLSFARILEQENIFASVTVPVSNFASAVDINFSILAKIK